MNALKKKLSYLLLICFPLLMMAAITVTTPIKVGDKAPAFTVAKLDGDSLSLNHYKGKLVVVHIWSHTCPHCRFMNQTLPAMVTPYTKANMAYIMIDIDIDTTGWRSIIREDKLSFAIHGSDPHDGASKVFTDYDGHGTPCINIVDEKGKLVALNITSDVQLKKFLRKKFPAIKS